MTLVSTLQDRNVDLDEFEAVLTFVLIGFSFNSNFEILKPATIQNAISRTEAQNLSKIVMAYIKGKPKSFLRIRLPLVLISLVGFSIKKAEGSTLAERTQTFTQILKSFESNNQEELSTILSCLKALNQPYYTNTLNSKLDPFANIFQGRVPQSFSNLLGEATTLCESKLQPSTQGSLPQPPSLSKEPSTPSKPSTLSPISPKLPTLTVVGTKPSPSKEITILTPEAPTKDPGGTNVSEVEKSQNGDTPTIESKNSKNAGTPDKNSTWKWLLAFGGVGILWVWASKRGK